jgi:hypothetical protein
MKYRALLGDRFLDIEAESEAGAQEQAFARLVRDLSPGDFTVWPTGPGDDWKEPARER